MNQVSSLRNDKNHNSGPLNPTAIWCFRLGACELEHISVCKREPTVIILDVLGATGSKFSVQGKRVPRICAPLY